MSQDKNRNFKLFFSHRTSDAKNVEELLKNLKILLPNFPISNVSLDIPYSDNWKVSATSILEKCDGFICIISEDTHKSGPVDWEIREAHRLGKPIVLTNIDKNNLLPPACVELQIESILWNGYEVANLIGEMLVPSALFQRHNWIKEDQGFSLLNNQYNLMVQSWESLIARRQTVNTVYISASSALLAGIGALVASIDKNNNLWAIIGIGVLAFLGAALSYNWRRTITSYGTLSRAKSKVVTALESYMPAQLFDTEWRVLESKRYKSTTETDSQTAQFFILLFILVFIVCIGLIIFQTIF
jgi:hypothetical protein